MLELRNYLFALFIVTPLLLSAQNGSVEMSEPIETRGLFTVVGELEDKIVVEEVHVTVGSSYGNSSSSFSEKFYIFNKDLTIAEEYDTEGEDLLRRFSYEKNIDISIQNDIVTRLVLDLEKKNRKKPKLKVISAIQKKGKKTKTLLSFKEKTDIVDSDEHFLGLRKHVNVLTKYVSDDKSKIVLLVTNKKKSENRIMLLDRRNNYEILNNYILDLSTDKEKRNIVNLAVSNNGKVGVVVSNELSKKEKKSREGNKKYDLELFLLGDEGHISHVINTQGQYWPDPTIYVNESGEVFLSALLCKKKDSKVVKFYSAKFNQKLENIYELNTTPKNLSRMDSKFGKHYKMSNIAQINDDLTICVSTNLKRKNSGDLITHRYTFKGFTIDAVDGEGKYLWSKTIDKNDEQRVAANCVIPSIFYSENGLDIFMNYSDKTINQYLQQEPKKEKYPLKKNILTRVTVDTKGKIELNKISGIDKYSYSSNIYSSNGEYFFMLVDNKFKKACFAKSDFAGN